MLFTKATEYALFSVIYLAKSKEAKDVESISQQLKISKSFLAKILQKLAKDDILVSHKGINGGFHFVRDPATLRINEIIQSVEKKATNVFECASLDHPCSHRIEGLCKVWKIFSTLQKEVDNFLNNLTLEDILNMKEEE